MCCLNLKFRSTLHRFGKPKKLEVGKKDLWNKIISSQSLAVRKKVIVFVSTYVLIPQSQTVAASECMSQIWKILLFRFWVSKLIQRNFHFLEENSIYNKETAYDIISLKG